MIKRASLGEIWRKVVKIKTSDKDNVYYNGENNLYPNEVEGVIRNSPTASRAQQILSKFISGEAVLAEGKYPIPYEQQPIINERRRWRITDLYRSIASSIATQGGAFVWVGYQMTGDGLLMPYSYDVLDYAKCRISKFDDKNFEGRVFYGDWEKNSSFGQNKKKEWFYPYSDNQAVIEAQIWADGRGAEDILEALKLYRGQVFFINSQPELIYPNSTVDSVFNDCDSEYRISVYINEQLRNGFTGKTIAILNGLDEETSNEIKNDLKKFMGVENSSSFFILETDGLPDLNSVLKIEQVPAQYSDKILEKTTQHLRKNILGAFYNIPEILILSSDGAMFGASGEALREVKNFFNDNTSGLRELIELASSHLKLPYKIKPL
jgi:hypothetical protein